MLKFGVRTVLVVEPDNPLIVYAAALGVVDILVYPVKPETILYRLTNPATTIETAELVRSCSIKKKEEAESIKTHFSKYIAGNNDPKKENVCTSTALVQINNENSKPQEPVIKDNEFIDKVKQKSSKFLSSFREYKLPNLSKAKITNQYGTVTHRIIAVWSPTGSFKSITALNLAISGKAALINYDLTCPELDIWFGIKQTGIQEVAEKDAGILTMGDAMHPKLVPKMLREMKWGVLYLPAGTKLGNIGTPSCVKDPNTFKQIIETAMKEVPVIVDAGRDFELPPTYAALSLADVIVIPITTPQEGEIVSCQLTELARVGIVKPTVELIFGSSQKKVCQYRIQSNIDCGELYAAAAEGTPHCLTGAGQEWVKIFDSIAECRVLTETRNGKLDSFQGR